MKYKELIGIRSAIQTLSKMDLPVRDAYRIFQLNKRIDEVYRFVSEREEAIVEKWGGKVSDDGSINFAQGEGEEASKDATNRMSGFIADINALHNAEAEIEMTPVTLSLDEMGNQHISPADMIALDGLIGFE